MTTAAPSSSAPFVVGAQGVHERALVRLAALASAEYDAFVFRDRAASEQFNLALYRSGGSCFAPHVRRLLLVNDMPVGFLAIIPPDALKASRLAWAGALPRASLRNDPGLRERFRLATRALVRPLQTDAYLIRIAVAPEFAGRGLGRRLLDEALAETRRLGLLRCVLEVADTNERALAMYERAGFTCIGQASATAPDSGATLRFIHMGKEVG